jgi:cyclohexyl-isocyanide hydratase
LLSGAERGTVVGFTDRDSPMLTDAPLLIGFVAYPGLTQLDLTGPLEVFSRLPGVQVLTIGATLEAVQSDSGLRIVPDVTCDSVAALDLVCVPGGPGVNQVLEDPTVLDFLRRVEPAARYVTSVCSGSLILGAAGLLRGYRATSHWLSLDLLAAFGATPVAERVVVDRNRITGGGVTAGIDFGLTVAAELRGREAAERVQLMLEYDPAPPFDAGSPARAPASVVEAVRSTGSAYIDARREIVRRAAARLDA